MLRLVKRKGVSEFGKAEGLVSKSGTCETGKHTRHLLYSVGAFMPFGCLSRPICGTCFVGDLVLTPRFSLLLIWFVSTHIWLWFLSISLIAIWFFSCCLRFAFPSFSFVYDLS